MQIVDAQEMAQMEKRAIEEGASSEDFMKRASKNMALALKELAEKKGWVKKVTFVAGNGNNGGDAFCTALELLNLGFEVRGYVLEGEKSPLCQKYLGLFQSKKALLKEIKEAEDFDLVDEGLLLDGLLGTGFHGKANLLLLALFKRMNLSKAHRIAIDIPSGLNGNTGEVDQEAFEAHYTLFLGLAKTGFFIRSGWNHVGKLIPIDFGLEKKYLEEVYTRFELLESKDVLSLFPKIIRNRHKYEAGFVVGLSGSRGMMGASILSGMAALKSGAGMVKVLHLDEEMPPSSIYPELIHFTLSSKQTSEALELMNKANVVYIGPGIGQSKKMSSFLKEILPQLKVPCVLDADALNLLAQNHWKYPSQTLITPHLGEMSRLVGRKIEDPLELIHECEAYAQKHDITLILKGGPSFIFQKGHKPKVCPKGDPGLATAGSGDVLTGMLAGLWAQKGMSALSSAQLGVYLHGLVGEYGAHKKSSYSLTASDLLKYLYKGFTQELFNT